MADEEDLAILNSGNQDLGGLDLRGAYLRGKKFIGCSFSGSDLKDANLRKCHFVNCNFEGAHISKADFREAVFDECRFNGYIGFVNWGYSIFNECVVSGIMAKCSFEGVSFRSCKVEGLTFLEGNNFLGAHSSGGTDFSGTKMPRKLHQEPIFKRYSYSRGKLNGSVREDGGQEWPRPDILDKSTTEATSAEIIRSRSSELLLLSSSLQNEIEVFLEDTPIPNDPDQLKFFEKYSDILNEVLAFLNKFTSALSAQDQMIEKELLVELARDANSLSGKIAHWWSNNSSETVDYGFRISMLGSGVAFLSLCGVPASFGTAIAALMIGGDRVRKRFEKE